MLISVSGGAPHARRIGERLGIQVVEPEVRRFPDGELYVRLDHEGIDREALREVAIVGNLVHDSFLEIAFLAGTARDLGATRVGLIAPYLAYMRQDSVFKNGEGVTSRYFGKLVSASVDWLVTVDPHLHRYASLSPVYTIPTTVARSASAIADWVAAEVTEPVLVGPDAESVQWVSAIAERCGAPYVIMEKTRRGDRDVSVAMPECSRELIETRAPVVIDDIISTGKTMVEATRQLRAAGAAPPMCVAIHAVFADAVHEELLAAGAKGIVSCDTIAHASNRIAIDAPLADAVRGLLG